MSFELKGVTFTYEGAQEPAVRNVTLALPPGRHTVIVGPNGAGKSTLLRVLLGILPPAAGEARIEGRPSREWPRRELAQRVGVVAQEEPAFFPLDVSEYAAMGRHPHLRPWSGLSANDRRTVREALERTGLSGLAGREISRLSAGEMQRARLARALAQTPRHLVLDEPTVHLDLGHEVEFFELVAELVREGEVDALTITHNLGLASRYADHLVLLVDGQVLAEGSPAEVLTPPRVEAAFGWPVRVLDLGPFGLGVVPLTRRGFVAAPEPPP